MAKIKDEVIGKRIRQARQDLSFTQEEVATAIEISRSKYANIESGRTQCSASDAKEICDYLGLDVNELLKADNSELEGLILFREEKAGDNERLLDLSDNIFKELIGQQELYHKYTKDRGHHKYV